MTHYPNLSWTVMLSVMGYWLLVFIAILVLMRYAARKQWSEPEAVEEMPPWSVSGDATTAVSNYFFFQPMNTCPLNLKVILRVKHGVAVTGIITRETDVHNFNGWSPYPRDSK